MTNILQQAGISIARIKGRQFRLLSQADDSTIAANASAVLATNNGPAVPCDLFGNGGSGLTLTLAVSGSAVNTATVANGGSGYPPSSIFNVLPLQAGGSGAVVTVLSNSSGVVTSASVAIGGSGYTNGTVPTVVSGHRLLNGGSATLGGSADCYLDSLAAGFCLVNATQKNLRFYNLDAVNAATVEVDFFAGTT